MDILAVRGATAAVSAERSHGGSGGATLEPGARPGLVLAAVLLATLVLRLLLLPDRWINPDEGAHLMDGLLALEGLIPKVDFGSRQPLYVYGLALSLKMGGVSLFAGRLMPLATSLLTGVALYLLCAELVGKTEGLLAATIYLLLPLEVLQSVVVKTEAPATVLVVASLWALVAGLKRDRGWLVVAGGVLGAAGFYVRQTTLLVPIVAAILLIGLPGIRTRVRVRSGWRFLTAYLATFALAALFYARLVPWRTALGFTPFGFVLRQLGAVGAPGGDGSLLIEAADVAVPNVSAFGEPYELYYAYLRDAVDFHWFLLLVVPLAALAAARVPGLALREARGADRVTLLAAFAWLALLTLMYGLRYTDRGFFIDYFREFLPALCVFVAVWLTLAVPELRRRRNAAWSVLAFALASGAWFALRVRFPGRMGIVPDGAMAATLFAAAVVLFSRGAVRARLVPAAVLLGLATVLGHFRYGLPVPPGLLPGSLAALAVLAVIAWSFRSAAPGPWSGTVRLMTLVLVVGAYGLSLSYSARRLTLSYEAVWPPEVAAEVSSLIAARTPPDAEVASGAVVWEFGARRRPFDLISHPLGMKRPMEPADRALLATRMRSRPPAVIVLDGYTEETYGRNVAAFDSLVSAGYSSIGSFDAGFRPVRVMLRTPIRTERALP